MRVSRYDTGSRQNKLKKITVLVSHDSEQLDRNTKWYLPASNQASLERVSQVTFSDTAPCNVAEVDDVSGMLTASRQRKSCQHNATSDGNGTPAASYCFILHSGNRAYTRMLVCVLA